MSDDAENGWDAVRELIGLVGDEPPLRYWGEIERELEVHVDGDGVVLSKGYREHGRCSVAGPMARTNRSRCSEDGTGEATDGAG